MGVRGSWAPAEGEESLQHWLLGGADSAEEHHASGVQQVQGGRLSEWRRSLYQGLLKKDPSLSPQGWKSETKRGWREKNSLENTPQNAAKNIRTLALVIQQDFKNRIILKKEKVDIQKQNWYHCFKHHDSVQNRYSSASDPVKRTSGLIKNEKHVVHDKRLYLLYSSCCGHAKNQPWHAKRNKCEHVCFVQEMHEVFHLSKLKNCLWDAILRAL